MNEKQDAKQLAQKKERAAAPGDEELEAMRRASRGLAFGPSFFLERLGPFIREGCAGQPDRVPAVHLHLGSGAVIDVCHIIGITPDWLAVKAYDERLEGAQMHTELIPYGLIMRVSIRALERGPGRRMGFRSSDDETEEARPPKVWLSGSD